jgi:toxin YoeB
VRLAFQRQAWEDASWFEIHDRTSFKRLSRVIDDALRDPYDGIGKPERLVGDLSGWWSRRITDEHRLVYRLETSIDSGELLVVAQARYHY